MPLYDLHERTRPSEEKINYFHIVFLTPATRSVSRRKSRIFFFRFIFNVILYGPVLGNNTTFVHSGLQDLVALSGAVLFVCFFTVTVIDSLSTSLQKEIKHTVNKVDKEDEIEGSHFPPQNSSKDIIVNLFGHNDRIVKI